MIYTSYYSRPFNMQGPSTASMLGLGAASFGIGYLGGMSKDEKHAMQNKIRGWIGLPPKAGAPQAPAPVSTATPNPVATVTQKGLDPSQLAGNAGTPSTSPSANTENILDNSAQTAVNAQSNPDDFDSAWTDANANEGSAIPSPVDLNNGPEIISKDISKDEPKQDQQSGYST